MKILYVLFSQLLVSLSVADCTTQFMHICITKLYRNTGQIRKK